MTAFTAHDIPIFLAIAGFALMGVGAIAAPTRVTRQFGIVHLDLSGRNEVRAVYGGFGLALAAILAAVLVVPTLRTGVCLAVAAALVGMASGRMISAVLDRALPLTPGLYLVLEATMAAALVYAA